MDLQRFDPAAGSAAVRACYDVYLSGVPDDDPLAPPMSYRCFAGWLQFGWTADPVEAWLARDSAGKACGWYELSLPERENQRLARVTAMVHAARRRNGLGSELVRHAAARARQLGRTAVARPHRGHRLGLLVKVAMLELLAGREPQLSQVITGNADRNEHMIAINAKLGFQVLDRWQSWEVDVASTAGATGRAQR